jgi:hypothetical protein
MELPSSGTLLELVAQYGRLRARLSAELGKPILVLPTNEFFPDRFDGSQAAAAQLVHRMQRHAHIEDIPVHVAINDRGPETDGSCSSGACGTIQAAGNAGLELQSTGWMLTLSPAELGHPVALTGAVARALGAIFLEETRPDAAPLPQPLELYSELSAVALGLGVLLLESSHLYTKACSGPRVTQLTALASPELAVLVASYAAQHQLKLKAALKASSLTQRTLLRKAQDMVRVNPQLVRWLVQANVTDPTPTFALLEDSPPLFRGLIEKLSPGTNRDEANDLQTWLDASKSALVPALPTRRPGRVIAKPDDDLKALVAEALDSTAS